jgi:hypothetical protein
MSMRTAAKSVLWVKVGGVWCAAMAVIGAIGIVSGAGLTMNSIGLLLTMSLVPPGVMWMLADGAATATVAEVLYAAQTHEDVRR